MKLRSLGVGILTTLSVSAMGFCLVAPQSKNPVLCYGLATACVISAKAVWDRDELIDQDSLDSALFNFASESCTGALESIDTITRWTRKTPVVKAVPRLLVKFTPKPLQSLVEKLSGDDWFSEFLKEPAIWLVGRRGSGKTLLAIRLIYQYLQDNPDGELYILDINYGKPDEDGKINRWGGLPLGKIIFNKVAECRQIIEETWEELQTRAEACALAASKGIAVLKLKRRLLAVEEIPGLIRLFVNTYGSDAAEQLRQKLADIFYQGRGYLMNFLGLSQNSAVGETGINLAMQAQLATCLMGTNATDAKEVGKIPGADADVLIPKIKEVRSQPGGKYSVVVQLPGTSKVPPSVEVKVLPDLTPYKSDDLFLHKSDDPDEQWWNEIWTPEKQQEVRDRILAHLSDPKVIPSPRAAIAEELGISRPDNSNKRYREFLKPAYDLLVEQLKSTV